MSPHTILSCLTAYACVLLTLFGIGLVSVDTLLIAAAFGGAVGVIELMQADS